MMLTRKPKWKFQKELLRESGKALQNPGRGWYRIFPFSIDREPDFEELFWCLDPEDTLALVLLDIGCCRERNLTGEELERVSRIFRFFIGQKKKMILRVVYDREGKGPEREPAFFSLVQEHMRQIGSLVRTISDEILVFQGLFVGSWGELHSSRYLGEQKIRGLWETLRDALGDSCWIAMRTPAQLRLLGGEETLGDAKLALYNDGMFGSDTHLGTFGQPGAGRKDWKQPWEPKEEFAFADRYLAGSPNGGEALNGLRPGREQILETLRQLHVCYLNKAYEEACIARWKETPAQAREPYEGLSLYEYIERHLGYRFVVKQVQVTEKDKKNTGSIQIRITIKNTGFGQFFGRASLWLTAARNGQEETCPLEGDLGQLSPGGEMTFQGCLAADRLFPKKPEKKELGDPVSLFLQAASRDRPILFANQGAGELVELGRFIVK